MTAPLQYIAATGRLVIRDATTVPVKVLLDTDTDDFLCVKPSDYRTGSQVIPQRVASSEGVDGSQVVVDLSEEYFLGTIDIPNARVVRGMVKFESLSDPQSGDDIWQKAGGSQLAFIDGVSQTTVPQSDLGGFNRVASMGFYSLYVNELNHLILQERLVMRCRDRGSPPEGFLYRRQLTVSYRILIGFWLNQYFSSLPGIAYRGPAGGSTGTSVSLTGDFGYAYSGRRIGVAISSRRASGSPGTVPTSVTIGGVSATLHASETDGVRNGVSFWSAVVPTGTSGAVVVNHSVSTFVIASVFAVANLTTVTKSVSSSSGSNTSAVSMTVPDNKVGLVISASSFASEYFWAAPPVNTNLTIPPTRTDWTSATFVHEDYQTRFIVGSPSEVRVNGMHSCAVVRRGAGSVTPTVIYRTRAGAAVNGTMLTMGLVLN